MRLLILGASGGVGKHLVREALAGGHEITALVRSPEKLAEFSDRVTLNTGDYLDAEARARSLAGAEAVLSTIGPPLKRNSNKGEYARAMTEFIGQMKEADVTRIVAIGGAGLRLGDEALAFPRVVMRQLLRFSGGKGYDDKEREHNALVASGLDWTILRPPQIVPTDGQFTVSTNGPAAFKVDPTQLARHMLACLNDPTTVHTAPFVATK